MLWILHSLCLCDSCCCCYCCCCGGVGNMCVCTFSQKCIFNSGYFWYVYFTHLLEPLFHLTTGLKTFAARDANVYNYSLCERGRTIFVYVWYCFRFKGRLALLAGFCVSCKLLFAIATNLIGIQFDSSENAFGIRNLKEMSDLFTWFQAKFQEGWHFSRPIFDVMHVFWHGFQLKQFIGWTQIKSINHRIVGCSSILM